MKIIILFNNIEYIDYTWCYIGKIFLFVFIVIDFGLLEDIY